MVLQTNKSFSRRIIIVLLFVVTVIIYLSSTIESYGKEKESFVSNSSSVPVAPSDVTWVKAGVFMFTPLTDNAIYQYEIKYQNDIYNGDIDIRPEDINHSVTINTASTVYGFNKTGSYQLRISLYSKDSDEERLWENAVYSDTVTYNWTKPAVSLETPGNLKMSVVEDDGDEVRLKVTWNSVPHAAGYYPNLYRDGSNWGGELTKYDVNGGIAPEQIFRLSKSDFENHEYCFRVQALSPDLTIYSNSEYSEKSSTIGTPAGIKLANGLTIYKKGAVTESEVIRRINEIRTVFPGDKDGCCFNDGTYCSSHGAYGKCNHCNVRNVMNSMQYADGSGKSFKLLRGKDAYTCMGFVTFVYEYVFRRPFHNGDDSNENDPKMLDSYIGKKAQPYSYEYVTQNAVIGDVLIFKYKDTVDKNTGEKIPGGRHWAIYMGADTANKKIILYESNGMYKWKINAVHYGTRNEDSFKTVTIRRDIEYDKGITANTHTYRNNKDFFVNCPVNIEVISGNEVVGRITENVIDEDVSVIDMYVNGDEKMFSLPDDSQYKIKLSAFDSGTMDFAVCTPGAGDEGVTKQFRDIALTEGKLFETDVVDNTAETKLFVVNSEGKKIGEVSENGTEKAIDSDSVSDDNLKQTPPVDPYLYETLTAGDSTYTIKWPKTVKFDGRKHNGVGMTADNSPYNPKESSSKICDVEVTISMNGEIIDPSSYTVKTKNNKKANLSPDGTETIQQKTPSFKIKAKGEVLSGLKDQLKSKNFEFGILPIELNKEKMSFENQKTAKDGSTVFGKVLFNGPEKEGHPSAKTLKLKYKPDESKTDYVTTVSENGDLLLTGKNNYYGTVTCK